MSEVHCDACLCVVPASYPRVHCLESPDHDLCIRCHNVEVLSQCTSHVPSHRNTITSFPPTRPQSSTATAYWDRLLTASGDPSPIFVRFLSALFTHFDGIVEPRHARGLDPFKMSAVERALGVPDSENVILGPIQVVASAGGTYIDSDALIAAMYRAREIEYLMATRQSDMPVWHGMPVLTRGGFVTLHVQKLVLSPRVYWEGMNKVLREIPLVDPATGVGFQWKSVPWESCPQGPIEAAVQRARDAQVQIVMWFHNYVAEKKTLEVYPAQLLKAQAQMIRWSHEADLAELRGLMNAASFIV